MGNVREVIDGLEIFARYMPQMWLCAEHDIIYGPHGGVQLTNDERLRLGTLGWFIDIESGCWARHV